MTVIDTETELVYFSDLKEELQDEFRAKSMLLYPGIFGEKTNKFVPLVKFLLEEYKAVTPSIRDIFSASGKQEIVIGDLKALQVRAIDAKLHALAPVVHELLLNIDQERLIAAWGVQNILEDRAAQFALVLNSNSEQVINNILVGDAFLSGL